MGARSTGSSRRYSMNPVGFPIPARSPLISADPREVMGILVEGRHDGLIAAETLLMRALERGDRALEVLRHDAHESRHAGAPMLEYLACARAPGEFKVAFDHATHALDFLISLECLHLDQLGIHPRAEVACLVEHLGDTTGHPGAKVAARRTQHHAVPASHVLAAVIPHCFDDRIGAAIAHREALARHAAD